MDLAVVGREIVDASLYLVLGTADRDGVPWVSPVYFAPSDYRELFWVSRPERKHSRNIAARPEVSVVVFDSSAPIGTGRGVYMAARARELGADECEEGVGVFSRRSLAHGGTAWTVADVRAPAPLRLYRAVAEEQFVGDRDDRIPVAL